MKYPKTVIGLIITCFFSMIFIHFYLPRIFIEPNNVLVKLLNKPIKKLTPDAFLLNYKSLQIATQDGVLLNGYKIYTEQHQNKGTIILLHGIRAYKEHFLPICKRLAKQGFNTVIIDLRGHGKSTGTYCTFGYKEKNDISSVVDHILEDHQLSNNIGVWGQSLGGAIALQTMAIDKRIQFGVIESTFSDLRNVSKEYLKRLLKIDQPIIANYLLNRAYKIADIGNVQPKESAKEITQPIILVHGKKDKRINIYHALLNYKNIASTNKKLLTIKNANHLNLWEKGGDNYLNTIISFFKDNTKSN